MWSWKRSTRPVTHLAVTVETPHLVTPDVRCQLTHTHTHGSPCNRAGARRVPQLDGRDRVGIQDEFTGEAHQLLGEVDEAVIGEVMAAHADFVGDFGWGGAGSPDELDPLGPGPGLSGQNVQAHRVRLGAFTAENGTRLSHDSATTTTRPCWEAALLRLLIFRFLPRPSATIAPPPEVAGSAYRSWFHWRILKVLLGRSE